MRLEAMFDKISKEVDQVKSEASSVATKIAIKKSKVNEDREELKKMGVEFNSVAELKKIKEDMEEQLESTLESVRRKLDKYYESKGE